MAFLNRASDRLQTALQGGPADESLRPDVEVVRALGEMRLGQNAHRPEPAFVAQLAARLLAQQPVPQARPLYTGAGRHRYPLELAPTRGPVVSLVANTVPRVAASMGASAFVVGAVLGVSSRASMPGQTLYPVSNLIDSAALTLAGSEQSRGETLLSQAERHIGQAQELASMARRPGSSASADDVQAALQGALDSATKARQILEEDFALRGDPSSLVALRNFTLRVTPALAGLVGSVPATARSLAGQLQSTVNQIGAGASTGLTACPGCLPVVALTHQQLASSSTALPPGASSSSGTSPSGTSSGVGEPSTSGEDDTSGGTTSSGTPVSGGPASGSTTGSSGTPPSPAPDSPGSPAAPPPDALDPGPPAAPPADAPEPGPPAAPPGESAPPADPSDPSAPPAPPADGTTTTVTGSPGQPSGALDGSIGSAGPAAPSGGTSGGGEATTSAPPSPPASIPAPPADVPGPPVVSPPAAKVLTANGDPGSGKGASTGSDKDAGSAGNAGNAGNAASAGAGTAAKAPTPSTPVGAPKDTSANTSAPTTHQVETTTTTTAPPATVTASAADPATTATTAR